MFVRGEVTYLYFLIIDSSLTLLEARSTPASDPEDMYLSELRDAHGVSANWEAAGAQTIIINRPDKVGVEVVVPFEPLFEVKLELRQQTIEHARDMYGQNRIDWVELYAKKHPELVGIMTFSRDEEAQWFQKDNPVARSVNARGELGFPGGPCHVIWKVEESNLPDRAKKELIEDIEKGKDFSRQDEKLLYKSRDVPAKVDLFNHLSLTSHVQFRMDQRGITVHEIETGLDEFTRWYLHRKKNPHNMSSDDQKLFSDMAYGEPIRFDARKSGLTIVFVVDAKGKKAILVSTWWSNKPNPPKPRPGECVIMDEYLDRDHGVSDRPAILGRRLVAQARQLHSAVRRSLGVQDE